MTELATLIVEGRAATLSLERGAARNALSIELLDALHGRVEALAAMHGVSACVVRGGGRAFCAGMDLKAIVLSEHTGPEVPTALLASLAELTLKLRALPMLTIARVHGAAIGGGCGLACVCDVVLTHESAKLGFPEVDLGVCPAVVAPWLARKIGHGRARAVLLRGGLMTGAEAAAVGIADRVLLDEPALDAAVAELVARVCAAGPTALAATKRLLNELDGSLDGQPVRRGAELSASVVVGEEAQTSLRARLAAGS